ncbi:DUF6105 family protein [Nitratireductor sp. GISD-1A_MAKvit]|uniref:DUF6105 family protein n=1 Tax=Nitratireductor sp. GISD-1A_MAKvit TaxID=3234198 RepID=UPI003465C343
MMRYLLLLWALPLGLFWGWYGLSYHDLSLGFHFLSRDMNDMFFGLYGNILGIDPAIIPGMAARACVLDTFILFGILAFRRRRALWAWFQEKRAAYRAAPASPSPAARNLSSAP